MNRLLRACQGREPREAALTLCAEEAGPGWGGSRRPAAPGRGRWPALAGEDTAGHWLRLSLAGLWLLDAALQSQAFMFSPGFARMLAASASGNPAVVAAPILWAAHLTGQHPAAAGAVFAVGQAALGLGIAWRPATKIALGASAGWALAVWWLGEGFSGLLSGTASPADGAPGAVILYALLAFLLWPGRRAGWPSPLRRLNPLVSLAPLIWLALWGGLACLAVADAPASPLPALRHSPGSVLLAAAFALIAVTVLLPPWALRAGVIAAIMLSLALWAAGQDFGGVLTGMGTDPDTGPVLALLALAYWPPGRRRGQAQSVLHHGEAADAVPDGREAPRAAPPPGGQDAPPPGAPDGLLAGGRDVTVMQVLMGLAMAGMMLPQLIPVPAAAWAALATAGLAWSGWRSCRALTGRLGRTLPRTPARALPGIVRCGQAPGGNRAAARRHGDPSHLLACGAMLYMAASGMAGTGGGSPAGGGTAPGAMGMAGMGTAGMAPGPVLALVLAAAMAGCAVVLTDRLAALGPATGRVPRVTACCQLAMGLTMACLLARML